MKNKLSHEAIFMVGGDFTSDGLKFLKTCKQDFKGPGIKVIATSIISRALKKERPFVIHTFSQSEEILQQAWWSFLNRVNLIGSFERSWGNQGLRWMSWSNMNPGPGWWTHETLLTTWTKQIDPWRATPTKRVIEVKPVTEILHGMSLSTLQKKAGPALRLVKT